MARPPMKDTIKLHIVTRDEEGNVLEDKYGKAKRHTITTKARVKYSSERVFTPEGEEITAVLALSLPPDVEIHTGDLVEWVDRFKVTVIEPIYTFSEVLNYGGDVCYYRKAWAGKAG